jgi:hypothetical protein
MSQTPRRLWIALAAFLVAGLVFVYRFGTLGGALGGFDNDHFVALVRAQHVLDGEQPLRDFADAELRAMWPPLTYATSAAAQVVLGESLRSEAILTVGLLALGAALTLWAAADVARSTLPAAIVATVTVALGPKLYNYPKILAYAAAVLLMVAYARRPTTGRLLPLAALTAVATLYRHDHGVFLSVSVVALILLARPVSRVRALASFALAMTLVLLPGIAFVHRHVGVLEYVRSCLELSRQEATRTTAALAAASIDWSRPLLTRVDSPEQRPRITVVWTAETTPAIRAVRERALGLEAPAAGREERDRVYELRDWSRDSLAAIARDDFVEDTNGFDRGTFSIADPADRSFWSRWERRLPLLRWRVAPGVLHEGNAVPWLYLVAWVTVLAALVSALVPKLASILMPSGVPPSAVGAIGIMGLSLLVVYLRNPVPARLPDVSVPVGVLGAWLVAAVARSVRSRPWPLRMAANGVLGVLVFVTMLAAGSAGEITRELNGLNLSGGLGGAASHWRDVWGNLGTLPDSVQADGSAFGHAVGYLRRCTSTADRLLVGDFAPELNYFSGRRFAAGQIAFFSDFYTAQEDQRLAVRRWLGQSVPIVLVKPENSLYNELSSAYPIVAAHLRSNYRRAGDLDVGGRTLEVWVHNGLQGGVDEATGLPCFGRGEKG